MCYYQTNKEGCMKILIQGATSDEIDVLTEYYKPSVKNEIAGYEFFESDFAGHKIIISLTQKGIINATTSTTIALLKFAPDIVINQGCAGAHIESLKVGDIVIGEQAKYINDFKMPVKPAGSGSNSLEWTPHTSRSYATKSTEELVSIAKQVKTTSKVVVGALGSGDIFSREVDRIHFLHNAFNNLSEDMESASVLKVCEQFNSKRIAFRIISNNELTNLAFDASTRATMQKFVMDFVSILISK